MTKNIFALVFTFAVSIQSFALSCGTDTIISYTVENQTQPCTGHGTCTAADFNPETGNYESFYGFHASCPGTEEKRTDKYICQRADLSTYEDNTEGFWGFCNVGL